MVPVSRLGEHGHQLQALEWAGPEHLQKNRPSACILLRWPCLHQLPTERPPRASSSSQRTRLTGEKVCLSWIPWIFVWQTFCWALKWPQMSFPKDSKPLEAIARAGLSRRSPRAFSVHPAPCRALGSSGETARWGCCEQMRGAGMLTGCVHCTFWGSVP